MSKSATRTNDEFNDLIFRQHEIRSEVRRLEQQKGTLSYDLLMGSIGRLDFAPATNVKVRELGEKIAALNAEYDAISLNARAMLKEGVAV